MCVCFLSICTLFQRHSNPALNVNSIDKPNYRYAADSSRFELISRLRIVVYFYFTISDRSESLSESIKTTDSDFSSYNQLEIQ